MTLTLSSLSGFGTSSISIRGFEMVFNSTTFY
jgi:hypothetical protein